MNKSIDKKIYLNIYMIERGGWLAPITLFIQLFLKSTIDQLNINRSSIVLHHKYGLNVYIDIEFLINLKFKNLPQQELLISQKKVADSMSNYLHNIFYLFPLEVLPLQ